MKHESESYDSFRERLCEMFDKSDWTDLTTDRRIWQKDDWFTGPYLPSAEEMEYEIQTKLKAMAAVDAGKFEDVYCGKF